MSIGDHLEQKTYQTILADSLSRLDPKWDSRQGSIHYDALAPQSYELADFYMNLRQGYNHTFATVSTGIYLDERAKEQGLSRYQASYAYKKGEFYNQEDEPVEIPIGSRFSTISDAYPIIYVVDSEYVNDGVPVPGTYILRCEILGTIGNEYTGNLLNVTFITGVARAEMSDLIYPARDIETDEEFRQRYFEWVRRKPFGGNIADYRQFTKAIEGVGELQVYPVWNGGGTVKISVIDAEYNAIGEEFLKKIQNTIDPDNMPDLQGTGLGTAPIGHKVTVVTPTELKINVSCTVFLKVGTQKAQIEDSVKAAISAYLLELRKSWGIGDELNRYSCAVYIARITSAILTVPGVINVTEVKINSEDKDLVLTESAVTQQLPVMGELVIDEQ